MRRYEIVTEILLILSIINFALTVPVVQEKRQARIDVPRDAITVLGKRTKLVGLEAFWKESFEAAGSRSPDTHSSSSLGPENESTNVMPPPAPNPASSTTNQVPVIKLLRGSSSAPNLPSLTQEPWLYKGDKELPATEAASGTPHTATPTSSGYTSPDDEFAEAHWRDTPPKPDSWPDSEPSTVSDFNWDYRTIPEGPPPLPVRPASPKESGQGR